MARQRGITVIVDNTFGTPKLWKPLEQGADIVVHSATKYLNGHSDMIGGVAVTREAELGDRLWFLLNSVGGIQGPFDSFLALRGLKTLHLRMRAHCENAQRIAEWLGQDPRVERVIYPGLPDHPQHELAKRQMKANGGLMSFVVPGGMPAAAQVMNGRSRLNRCFRVR